MTFTPPLIQTIRSQCDQLQNITQTYHPFGDRPQLYCDWMATGLFLPFVEDALKANVMPYVGNPHSTCSWMGQQATHFLEESRAYIRQCTNCTETEHSVIFNQNGATQSIEKLISLLGLSYISDSSDIRHSKRPLVFVSESLHNSSLLPWMTYDVEIISLQTTEEGLVDQEYLQNQLTIHESCPLKLVVIASASNLNGIPDDVHALCQIVHGADAYAIVDFAASAPFFRIDMGGSSLRSFSHRGVCRYPDSTRRDFARFRDFSHPDAAFFSFHKFIGGGMQSAGVLLLHQRIVGCVRSLTSESPAPINAFTHPPTLAGGGTVLYNSPSTTPLFFRSLEAREEPGTPSTVCIVRGAMALSIKETVGVDWIQRRCKAIMARVIDALRDETGVTLVAQSNQPVDCQVPIVSVLLSASHQHRKISGDRLNLISPETRKGFLHPAFVCTLLSDLFGINVRSGTLCSGSFLHRILGVSAEHSLLMKQLNEGIRDDLEPQSDLPTFFVEPSVTRVSFHYSMSDEEVDFITSCLRWVARFGWTLLPLYRMNITTGFWGYTGLNRKGKREANVESIASSSPSPCQNESVRSQIEELLIRDGEKMAAQQQWEQQEEKRGCGFGVGPSEHTDHLHSLFRVDDDGHCTIFRAPSSSSCTLPSFRTNSDSVLGSSQPPRSAHPLDSIIDHPSLNHQHHLFNLSCARHNSMLNIADVISEIVLDSVLADPIALHYPPAFEQIRWFAIPQDVHHLFDSASSKEDH
ncbi:putative Cysteine desulfurase [Blattamonas nauphoetae]|uniref:Cysteine desulfurase n=1 Tax=Blattamonas nauphoetae TaxID=2049346 RepID=A0ABQ9YC31_9EUKA|nr:putative Cysteine desulfurase [Blattamonas nauphoetae]